MLQAIGKPNLPMIHAAISLAADMVAMVLLLNFTDLGIYSIVIAMIVYAIVMCVLNELSVRKYLGYRNPWMKAYIIPLADSIPMAAVAGGVYYGVHMLVHSNVISLGISVLLAVMVYFGVYILISKPTDNELRLIPGGNYLVKIASHFRR